MGGERGHTHTHTHTHTDKHIHTRVYVYTSRVYQPQTMQRRQHISNTLATH
jgi:hypothetical protein